MENKNPQQRITLDLGEKEAEGIYSNLTLISHSPPNSYSTSPAWFPGCPRARCTRGSS